MFSRTVNVALLFFAVALDSIILYFFSEPMVRLVLGLGAIMPIALISASVGLPERFNQEETKPLKPRRFLALRSNVDRLLGEIKRFNWLVYDKERGVRRAGSVESDLEACRAGMEEALRRVFETAGKPDEEVERALSVAQG